MLDTSTSKTSPIWSIARLLAGILTAIFIVWIFNVVATLLLDPKARTQPPVVLVYTTLMIALAALCAISVLFVRRGNHPSGRRQASVGCLLFILGGLAGSIFARIILAFITLNTGIEAALHLSITYLSTAIGGSLGLYLSRPSPVEIDPGIHGAIGNPMELEVGTSPEENSARDVNESSPKMQWLVPVLTVASAGVIASCCGWIVTYFGIVFSACLTPEEATDSGAVLAFGTLALGLWVVLGALVVLLGGLLGYVLFRYYRSRPEKPKTIWAAIIFGISVVTCVGITMVVLNQLLCIE